MGADLIKEREICGSLVSTGTILCALQFFLYFKIHMSASSSLRLKKLILGSNFIFRQVEFYGSFDVGLDKGIEIESYIRSIDVSSGGKEITINIRTPI